MNKAADQVCDKIETPEVTVTLCAHGNVLCAPCDYIPSSWKGIL